MSVVELEVGLLTEQGLAVLAETDVSAAGQHRSQEVVLPVATAMELIAHAVVDVEQVVSVLARIPLHLHGEGPGGAGQHTHTCTRVPRPQSAPPT